MDQTNPQPLTLQEQRIGEFFRLSILLKGALALVETIAGFLFLFITPAMIVQVISFLTQDELQDDPHDFIANHLMAFAMHLSISGTLFAALYLLSHGLIKMILVVALLKNKMWAYPWSLIVLSLFIVYQVYRYTSTHSLVLIALTVFDLVVLWLIWREYKIIKIHGGHIPQQKIV